MANFHSPEATSDNQSAPLLVERDASIATLTLNRPRARNALSMALITALTEEIAALSGDPSIRAVVIAANGPGFCAGHDLKELTARRSDVDRGRAFFAETMQACARMMQSIVHSPKPFVAAVRGVASAAGCQLVATCDLAVADNSASFATPGVDIGLFCSTPMIALSRNVTRKHAMEMLLLGDLLPAEKAATFGLINRVVPSGQALAEACAMAGRIADKSPLTVAIGKEAFYHQLEMPLSQAYDYAAEVMVKNMMARDAEEGINAFIEKRAPTWRGE
ncbi:MAG: enoyl-CoA hydratase [Hyphomicrobiaceae bacterium]